MPVGSDDCRAGIGDLRQVLRGSQGARIALIPELDRDSGGMTFDGSTDVKQKLNRSRKAIGKEPNLFAGIEKCPVAVGMGGPSPGTARVNKFHNGSVRTRCELTRVQGLAGLDYPGPMEQQVDLFFRESVFAWLRAESITRELFTRDDLSRFMWAGKTTRLVGTQTGIWRVKEVSDAAISILTAFVPDGAARPYEDTWGSDELLRYKWRGTNALTADNVWLRNAMQRQLPLVWFIGVGYSTGTKTQVFMPQFPVWIVDEEPRSHQFVVAVDEQRALPADSSAEIIEITKRYNDRVARSRLHQPLFRQVVLQAYERRCSVCRLPFAELLDAAHIRSDADGGAAVITNGLALCKIHHGAFDRNIIGIDPNYRVHVKESVLQTFDGPTLQHSIKEMHGEMLRQLPSSRSKRPDRNLLEERFSTFRAAS